MAEKKRKELYNIMFEKIEVRLKIVVMYTKKKKKNIKFLILYFLETNQSF